MAGKVVGWAFEQARELELSPTQRFILVAYADNASEAEAKCWPDKEEIIDKTGYSRATVFRAVKDLEARDLIAFTTDPKGRECAYLGVPWQSHCETGDSQSETGKSQGETRTNNKEPSKNRHKKKSPKKPARKSVDGKAVTEDELELTAVVVSLFNNAAGTELSVDPHLTPIVMRIREKPKYTESHHKRIIAAVFAGDHWWTGAPTPKIIYGNGAIFEQSIELARAAAKRDDDEVDVNAEFHRIRKAQGLE
jgi:hypothetical protein